MDKESMENDLDALVERLKSGAGSNLSCVILYGSAAAGEYHPQHSDLNILCLLARLESADLAPLAKPTQWWMKKGHPAPLLFTVEELRRSADLFAIELLDIQAGHRVLHGADPLASITVPMTLHRHQVERELKQNLIRLRESYLGVAGNAKSVLKLMTGSVSTFAALFRHALIALGEPPASSRVEAARRLGALMGFDPESFAIILRLREGKIKERELKIQSLFSDYLHALSQAVEQVALRLQ